ncbi:hypothetical protein PSU4_53600 [Pseudonocardia sulfidoxydans NBRC 16205]|uniref:Tetracyclin repressor-like C-terminal domain-containing protein n=1 Tax=Pseudonocardia sulfidoxydans NBRC 16205 TaxID=1223511 RepID=A0A511DNK8_9PSEU|nr:hypothetical protein PSU4_53600 [Pseudonocardia sulfidoxydans NBRC 16205]
MPSPQPCASRIFGSRGAADAAQLATGFVAVVQDAYLLAQTSCDVTPMVSAIDVAITHLHLLSR